MTEKDEEQEHNLPECGLLAKTRLCGQGMFISSRSLNSLPSIAIQLSCKKNNADYEREMIILKNFTQNLPFSHIKVIFFLTLVTKRPGFN